MSGKTDKILKKMKWAKEELYRSFSKEESDRVWKAAHDRLEGYLEECTEIFRGSTSSAPKP